MIWDMWCTQLTPTIVTSSWFIAGSLAIVVPPTGAVDYDANLKTAEGVVSIAAETLRSLVR